MLTKPLSDTVPSVWGIVIMDLTAPVGTEMNVISQNTLVLLCSDKWTQTMSA